MSGFNGFSPEAMQFLTGLATKDKEWFAANKKQYNALVAEPTKALVSDLAELLADRVSGGIEGQPKTNGSIAPINNDLRFSPDASPYKDHVMVKFWEGPNKKTAPTLWVRVEPGEGVGSGGGIGSGGIGFATGMVLSDLERWRSVIDDESTGVEGAELMSALVAETGADLVGEGLKKVPKPFASDHPRGDLLRHKGLQIRWIRPVPSDITSEAFVAWCATELQKAGPVHRWLVEHLT